MNRLRQLVHHHTVQVLCCAVDMSSFVTSFRLLSPTHP